MTGSINTRKASTITWQRQAASGSDGDRGVAKIPQVDQTDGSYFVANTARIIRKPPPTWIKSVHLPVGCLAWLPSSPRTFGH